LKYVYFLIAVLTVSNPPANAQEAYAFARKAYAFVENAPGTFVSFNIGFKFGYVVANNKGVIGGIEASLNYRKNLIGVGILISYEQFSGKISSQSGRVFHHYAIQGFWRSLGISFGPMKVALPINNELYYSATLFYGALIFPYYRFTFGQSVSNSHEIGMFAKLPIPIVINRPIVIDD
jgi:hypothetical protein